MHEMVLFLPFRRSVSFRILYRPHRTKSDHSALNIVLPPANSRTVTHSLTNVHLANTFDNRCTDVNTIVTNLRQIFRIGTVRSAEGLWRMRRYGSVIAHCTNSEDSALKHTRCSYQRYAPTAQSFDIVSSYEQKWPALSALNYHVNYRRSALSILNRVQLTLPPMQLRGWAVWNEFWHIPVYVHSL